MTNRRLLAARDPGNFIAVFGCEPRQFVHADSSLVSLFFDYIQKGCDENGDIKMPLALDGFKHADPTGRMKPDYNFEVSALLVLSCIVPTPLPEEPQPGLVEIEEP